MVIKISYEDKCSECEEEYDGTWSNKTLTAQEAGMAAGDIGLAKQFYEDILEEQISAITREKGDEQ